VPLPALAQGGPICERCDLTLNFTDTMASGFLYCPHCRQPLETIELGGFPRGVCPDRHCGFIHWNNPTPVVAAVVEHRGGLVLARNVQWPAGTFALVTGFLEQAEDPAAAAAREVEEELGLRATQPPQLIGHYPFDRQNQLIIAYHVRAEGEIVLNEELAEWRHVPFAEVTYWPRATGLALRDWLRGRGYDPQEAPLPLRS